MKVLNLMLLGIMLTAGATAQDAISTPSVQGAPGVEVVKNSWRRVVRNPKLEQDGLQVSREQASLETAQRDAISDNAALAKAGSPNPPRPIPTRAPSSGDRGVAPQGPMAEYVYEIKVRNTGNKTIRKLVWTYVALGASRPESTSRQYESKAKISPGKTKNLVVHSTSPPVRTINATKAGHESSEEPLEQLVIQRIEYDDGSVWTRSVN